MAQILYQVGSALRRVHLPVSQMPAADQTAAMLAQGLLPFDERTQHIAIGADHPASAAPLTAITVDWAAGTVSVAPTSPEPYVQPTKTAEEKLAAAREALATVEALADPVFTADVLDVLADMRQALED